MTHTHFVLPLLMPERQLVRAFPASYNDAVSPYAEVKDFSKAVRFEAQWQPKLKLRPRKVILIGDVAVGKTTLVNRFCFDKFAEKYKATIGVDFEIENFNVLGQNFTLEMWDTAGQERFKCIAQAYYRHANVIIVVFDMSKPETLKSTAKWLKSALAVNTIQMPLTFLVGTKSDLLSKEEFVRVERLAADIAEGIKAEYWSVSARTGYKIVDFFQRVAALSFETACKDAIIERHFLEKSVAVRLQRKSKQCDFRKTYLGNKGTTTKERSLCFCS
ncbi:ras-related protein Rab-34 isoform X1 [Anastrepha obliqua]|uniref:ras-related protein Rab-34 isoform X1 n=1 Tax=Anastrepha obliqua TaxID=95512 RepID=UPI0024094E61|nr:ras-related protein Rab-34 isoform X1 [Anastrepha obliqua]